EEVVLELRPGLWAGESLARASLTGDAQGAEATLVGTVRSPFAFFVEDEPFGPNSVDGDWVLDGHAVMHLKGAVKMDAILHYSGNGALSGSKSGLTMSGIAGTTGFALIEDMTIPVGSTQQFDLPVQFTHGDCNRLVGDWLFPLGELAEEAGWSETDISGYFYAVYMGDEPADGQEFVEALQRIWDRQAAWGAALLETGNVDLAELQQIVLDVYDILVRLDDGAHVECSDKASLDPFLSIFGAQLSVSIGDALAAREFDAANLERLVIAIAIVTLPDFDREAVAGAVHDQAQRIVDANLASNGDTCNPCAVPNTDAAEAARAVWANISLGRTDFTIDGRPYGPAEILEALSIDGS
ncbi:MAG: hypothetical protein WCE80_10990, partial [Acidimicrobiia bacterium]